MEDPRIISITAELEARPEVVLAYLFGSVARGTASAGSDIDIAILLSEIPENALRYRARLDEVLTSVAGTPVQVLFIADAPPALAGRVAREGKLLVCRGETQRVRTEVDIMRREFDTAVLRRMLDEGQSAAIRSKHAHG